MRRTLFTLATLVLLGSYASAQTTMPLYLKSGTKLLPSNLQNIEALNKDIGSATYGNKVFGIVQFDQIPTKESILQLKGHGISLLHYLPKNSFMAEIPVPVDQRALEKHGARALYFLSIEDKVDPLCSEANRGDFLEIWYYETIASNAFFAETEGLLGAIVPVGHQRNGVVRVSKSGTDINRLSQLPFIYYIENYDHRVAMDNRDILENPNVNKANYINTSGFSGAEGLSGKGVTALIVDGGNINPHLDLNKRISNFHSGNWSSYGEHAELVSGVMAGAGNLNPYNRGVAYKTKLHTIKSGSLLHYANSFYGEGVRITNNSYGSRVPSYGSYLADSRTIDLICNDKTDYLHFSSASNYGQETYGSYPKGFHTVNDDLQSAKNTITVGNISIYDSIMPSSSKGPMRDGRIKPEVCANGSHINRVSRGNDYDYYLDGGTSSATPSTAGVAALLSEYYKKTYSADPSSALIKNLLSNTADDKGTEGPDFTYGYGRVNARKALKVLKASQIKLDSVGNNTTNTFTFSLPAGLAEIRVMLTWNDPAAASNAGKALINDLDLELVAPSSTVYKPWILKHNTADVEDAATRGKDSINNMEQITLRTPASGTWTVRVKGYSVVAGKQPYFVTWDKVSPEIVLTYPRGGEKLEPNQTQMVQWDAYDNSPNDFVLEYTTDNGQNWTTIDNSINGLQFYYEWTTPNISSGQCKVRVSRKNTAVTDQSDLNFAIAPRPTGLTATALCTDYVQLKWNSVSGAQDYTVWYLDTIMKPLKTLTDTADTVALFSNHDYNWFAVSANFNGYQGHRCNSRQPAVSSSNSCPFQKDLSIDQLLAPVDGRKNFQNQLGTAEPVVVKVVNKGQSAISGFNLTYQLNSGVPVTEQYNSSLPAGDTLVYTFSTTQNLSAVGTHTLRAWLSHANDLQHANDTLAEVSITQYANAGVSLPYSEPFSRALSSYEVHDSAVALTNYPQLEYKNNAYGQLRSEANGGIYLESREDTKEAINYVTFNLNLAAHTGKSIGLRFKWTQFNESGHANDKLWVRGADTQPWIEALDLYQAFGSIDDVEQSSAVINLSDLLSQNGQSVSNTTQIRFGQQGTAIAVVTAFPNIGFGGVLLRDFELFEIGPDLAMADIVAPLTHNCGYPGTQTFSFNFRNSHHQSLTGSKASFKLDNGSATTHNLGTLLANSLNTKGFFVNNLALGYHTAKFWVEHANDTFPDNDTLEVSFFNSKKVYNYPYVEDFESNDGLWWTDGKNSSWEWGTPGSTDISQAGSGSKCWATRLVGVHNQYELSYLNSPCFTTSSFGVRDATLEALVFGDGGRIWVEYSNDGGNTWTMLGEYGEGTNWYNHSGNYWNGSFRGWHRVKYEVPNNLLRTNDQISFRFVFSANHSFNFQDGFGIDSFAFSILNQDLELLSLNAPSTTCGLSANEQMSIRVANLSHRATPWVPVRYTINNGAVMKDSIQNIDGEDTLTHNLRVTHDFTDPIEYEIDVWLESPYDGMPSNDSSIGHTFVSKPEITSFPYGESFETNIGGWHTVGGNSSWEHGSVNANQHPMNAGHGGKCWATNLGGNHNAGEVSYLVSPCFDLSQASSDPYFDFQAKYTLRPNAKFYVEYSEDGTNWSKLGSNGSGLNWYNHASHYFNGTTSDWTRSRWLIDRSAMTNSTSVQFRFVFENDINDNSTTAGVAIDYPRVYEIQNDVELVSIVSPASSCGLSNAEDIEIRVRNNSGSSQSNTTLYYSINNGAAQSTNLSTILANATMDITLATNADFSTSGNYTLKTWLNQVNDTYQDNDSATYYFLRSDAVSSFPYHHTFESNNGGWFGNGTNSSWAWGTPNNAPINQAGQGQKAWVTNLSGAYNANELSYLNAPCFDLDQFTGEAHISFAYYRHMNTNTSAWVEYSDDDGATWTKLGAYGDGSGWYSNNSDYWNGQASGWQQARMRLPLSSITNKDRVKLRWVFNSGAQTGAGFAIDDFRLFEVKDDASIASIENPGLNEGTGSKTVIVKVANNTQSTLSQIIMKYQLESGTIVQDTALMVGSDDTVSFSFSTRLLLTQAGQQTLKVWTERPNDNIRSNDTAILAMNVESTISTFPYYEGFENSNGNWTIGGNNPSWEWGVPNDALTNQAAHGSKCVATDLDGNVNAGELSHFTSPLFDFRGAASNPVFSFYNTFDVDWQSKYYIEYSENGNTWTRLGQFGAGTNWYNHGSHHWSQSQAEWKEAVYEIPLNTITDSSKVRFRFVLDIGNQSAYPGIAIDDIFIGWKGADLQVLRATAPDTSCALSNTETVSVTLKNLNGSSSGSYTLNYSLNGGNAVSQQFSAIAGNATETVSFTTKANLSSVQQHDFKVWTTHSTDHYHLNDTLEFSTFKSAIINSFPYVQTFESGWNGWITGGANSSWEVGTPASSSFTSAANGTQCAATNLDGQCNQSEFSYLISPCFDFRGMTGNPTILFNLAYKLGWGTPGMYIEYSEDGATWTKLGTSGSGTNWYNNNWDNLWDQSNTSWTLSNYEIPLNSITDSSAVKLRFVLKGSAWGTEEGVVIDDIRIQQITEDLELLSIDGPSSGAGLGQETVTVKVKNLSSQNLSDVFVYYRVNNGAAVKDTLTSISSGATTTFQFTQKVNASSVGSYVVDAWVGHGNDNQPLNDTVKGHIFTHTSYVSSFPYFENFESDNGKFYQSGTNSTWEHGALSPNNTQFKKAASGTKVWATDLDGNFLVGEQSYLYTPVFDLSGFSTNPILSLSMQYNVGFSTTVKLEYSEDGTTWTALTSSSHGVNWSDWGWTGEKLHWHTNSTEIPVSSMTDKDSVQFRVYFNEPGWAFETYEGLIVDNFHIHERARMHIGNSAKGLTKTVSGTGWIHFEKNSNRVMSIHPQGQNLGTTTVDCYVDQGNTRSYSDQYLLDRSWVVNPTTQPSSAVKVRLYYSDVEVDSIRLANSCGTCTGVDDAFSLTFTKYHGTNEDSLLTNNTSGTYAFFDGDDVTVIPYGRGYCAEFQVTSFSEIFGSGGGPGGNTSLPVELLDFNGEQTTEGVELTWTTATELNNERFEIQRAEDGIHFETIGTANGQGTKLQATHYNFIDPLERVQTPATVFYRLKQSDFDGTTSYSKTISLMLDKQSNGGLQAWPTVFSSQVDLQSQYTGAQMCAIVNAQGQTMHTFTLWPGSQTLQLSALPAGVYHLHVLIDGGEVVRLVKE